MIGDLILTHELHYGDPPNDGCCDAGPTMNSVPHRVIEYWVKPHALEKRNHQTRGVMGSTVTLPNLVEGFRWQRVTSFEREINRIQPV